MLETIAGPRFGRRRLLVLLTAALISAGAVAAETPSSLQTSGAMGAESFTFLGPPDQPFALHFDGTQSAQAPLTPLLDLGQSFTLEAWVYLDGSSTADAVLTVMGKRHDWMGDPFAAFVLDVSGGFIRYLVSTGQPGSLRAVYRQKGPIPGWAHFAVTQDAERARLFMNGVEAGQPLLNPPAPETWAEPFGIGGNLTPNGNLGGVGWVGALRQIRVWSRALAADEIRVNASLYLTGQEPGLLAYWPLDDGPGQAAARDLGPNQLPLMLGTSSDPDPADPQWIDSASPCQLSCAASAPASADAEAPVGFTADPTWTGCSGTPSYQWAFGDGAASPERSPTHSYATPGSYSWTVTVIVDGRACQSGDGITVNTPCTGLCAAGVQDHGVVGASVPFTGSASFCSGVPSYTWAFGDGQTSTLQNPSHDYPTAGTYPWSFTATAAGVTCSKSGAVTIGSTLTPAPQDWALRFLGGSAVLSADSPALDLGSSFTLETWIFPEEEAPSSFIMGRTHDPVNDPRVSYGLVFGDPWRVGFAQSTGEPGPQTAAMAPNPLPLRAWTHVAGVRDGGTLRLHINGEQVAETPSPGPLETSDMPFSLGNTVFADGAVYQRTISAALRQARVWNRALSAAELKANATRDLTGGEPGLVAYWPLDDGMWALETRDLGPAHLPLTWPTGNGVYPTWGHVSTLETGPYFAPQFSALPAPRPDYGALIDFDHDGKPDLVGITGATVSAYQNDGTGLFTDVTGAVLDPPVEVVLVNHDVVADFNGDGIQDVFLPDYGVDGQPSPAQSQLLLGTADGHLVDATAQSLPLVQAKTYAGAAADLRGLGRMDIFMGNQSYLSPTLPPPTFLLNDGQGHFTADSSLFPQGFNATEDAFFVDANNDGYPDLAYVGNPAPGNALGVYLLLNNGLGNLSMAPSWAIAPLQTVDFVTPEQGSSADLDGDGWPDIVIDNIWNSSNPDQWRLLLNNRDGTFRDASDRLPQDPRLGLMVYPESSAGGLRARFADFNGDGLLDILLCFKGRVDNTNVARLYLNLGSAQFFDASELLNLSPPIHAYSEVLAGDADGDGQQDVILPGASAGIAVARQLQPFIPPVDWTRNFTIDPSPGHRYVHAGESTTFDVAIQALHGFGHRVSLSTSVKPAHATIHTSLALDSIVPDGIVGVSIHTGPDTPLGVYWVTVAAASGDLSHTTSIPLIVEEPLPVQHLLAVTVAGDGVGTVTSVPDGIACPGDCTESYPDGASVTLTAAPSPGSYFAGWSGDCSGGGLCLPELNADRAVTATFLGPTIFLDGFASSDPCAWSANVGGTVCPP